MNKKLLATTLILFTLVSGLGFLSWLWLDSPSPTTASQLVVPTANPETAPVQTPTAGIEATATTTIINPSATPLPATATPTPLPTATPSPSPVPTPTPKPAFNTQFKFQLTDQVRQVRPGIIHIKREAKGPLKINVLLMDLTAKELDMRVESNQGWLSGLTHTSDIARSYGALAAVNGDEFSGQGLPQGMMVSNGNLFIAPKHRATFGWSNTREPFIGYFTQNWTWASNVVASNQAVRPLQLLNTPCDPNGLCIYNYFYRSISAQANSLRVILDENYEVVDIKNEAPVKIGPKETVLVGRGQSRAWLQNNVSLGDTLKLNLVTNPDFRKFDQVISGGPIILEDGKFVQDCLCNLRDCSQAPVMYQGPLCEEFTTEWKLAHYLDVHMPRVGIGFTPDKKTLILTTVDGYQPGYSIGMSPKELAGLMLEFGATSAMELDGGGSATMYLEGKLASRPSDGSGAVERYVANALLFYWGEDKNSNRQSNLP